MVEMPMSVRVGPHRYRVVLDAEKLRDFEQQRNSTYFGYSDHRKLEIILDPTQARDQLAETLFHEVKHCVCSVVGWRTGKEDEEGIISRMAPMELAVLKDNPDLVRFLLEASP